jgi:hypothetical protein
MVPHMSRFAKTIARLTSRYGEIVTLRRETPAAGGNAWTEGAIAYEYVAAQGSFRAFRPNELKGGILEHDLLCTLDVANIGAVPTPADYVTPGALPAEPEPTMFDYGGTITGLTYLGNIFGFTSGPGDAGIAVAWWRVVNVQHAREGGTTPVYKIQVRK